jgi:hypothetical protein
MHMPNVRGHRWRAMLLLAASTGHAMAQLGTPPSEADLLARGGKAIDEAALRALGTDHTLVHTQAATGQTYAIYYRGDGTRLMRLGAAVHTTRWSIKDGLRCDESVTRQTQCARVLVLADAYWLCRQGGAWCEWTFVARPGNVEGLQR